MADLDREEFDEETERREIRRKRRVRNQILAYVSAVIILATIIVGAGIGVHKGLTILRDKKQAQELQDQLDDMSAEQVDPITVEAPAETEEVTEEEDPLETYINEIGRAHV